MLVLTAAGLYCPRGGFHIDPSRGVDRAVVTHAHSDHARRGSARYYTAAPGVGLLQARLGRKISVEGVPYGKRFTLGGVTLSFHPAGHILGSAQVRLEADGEVWVASGDYKREPDPTCAPFQTVSCDVFVTEATFGTPGFVWKKRAQLGRQIHEWWTENAARGVNSVLFAYSLGKTQRVLGELAPLTRKRVHCHQAAAEINACYRAQGVRLAATRCLSDLKDGEVLKGELVLAPPSFLKTEQARVLGGSYETAFASGWTARGSFGCDKGFVMSDHADWDDLVRTIRETGARRVYVQHRNGALVRHLRELGLRAEPEERLAPADPGQLLLL